MMPCLLARQGIETVLISIPEPYYVVVRRVSLKGRTYSYDAYIWDDSMLVFADLICHTKIANRTIVGQATLVGRQVRAYPGPRTRGEISGWKNDLGCL